MGVGAGLGLICAKLSWQKIRCENDTICNLTELSENSREKCHVKCVQMSVNSSFCSVLVKQVLPLTSELQAGENWQGDTQIE